MLTRVCLSFLLLATAQVWPQMGSSVADTATTSDDEVRMLTPPPVSGEAYLTMVGSEMRSNYLATGLILNTAYNDNVLGGESTTPISDITYSIRPTITLDQTTPRQHWALTYSPGFMFYQHTTALNAVDQNAALDFQCRLSQHMTISLNGSFQKSSNVFSQLYPFSAEGISGSTQSTRAEVVAPFAQQLSTLANMDLSYQFSRNGMIGAGGIVTKQSYPNLSETSGLYDSNSRGGSAFYSHRLSSTQYIGVTYQYLRDQASPVNAQTNSVNAQTKVQSHALLPFYTIYFNPMLSLSLSSGPQYFDVTQSSAPPVRSWTPSATASFGWQRSHTNFVASYSRAVTGGVGLPGAFDSNNANAFARWRIARTWTIELAVNYATNKNVTPSFSLSSPGGHTISGTVSVQHSLSEHLKAELGYVRLHQSYSGIAVISNAPDSNRGFISVSYQFTRPVGR